MSTSLRGVPFALRALFALTAIIATIAYGISAWGVYGFAVHIWRLPFALAFGAAIVADLLSLAGLFATYLLRDAPAPVRVYAWSVFGGMTGLSVLANESYAAHRELPLGGRVAAAAIVIALAASAHLLIVSRRHAPGSEGNPTAKVTPAKRTPGRELPAADPRPDAKATPAAAPAARPRPATPPADGVRRTGRPTDPAAQQHRDSIARAVIDKATTKRDAAAAEGVSVKSVENWIKAYETRRDAGGPPPDLALTAPPSMNGATPAEVTS